MVDFNNLQAVCQIVFNQVQFESHFRAEPCRKLGRNPNTVLKETSKVGPRNRCELSETNDHL